MTTKNETVGTERISQNPLWVCPVCESDHVVRFGLRLECQDCGNEWERDTDTDRSENGGNTDT